MVAATDEAPGQMPLGYHRDILHREIGVSAVEDNFVYLSQLSILPELSAHAFELSIAGFRRLRWKALRR